jgi:hypothetical protein
MRKHYAEVNPVISLLGKEIAMNFSICFFSA